MAVLLSAFEISKSFGAQTLFADLTFSFETGQKIGLIGPNGAGKSTLLQIIAGLQSVDEGQISRSNGLALGYLTQSPRFDAEDTVFMAIAKGADDPYDVDTMGLVQELISRLDLESPEAGSDRLVDELSGGWRKRVALARELVKKPNLLLLDEPTNHLDLESILWLEDFIAQQKQLATVIVTHDRLFLQKTSDQIFDLDKRNPDGLIKFKGSYAEFVDFKTASLDAQKHLETAKKNTLRRETEWLRRGAQARQTKQKSRIDRAGDLKDEVQDLKSRNQNRRINMDFGEIDRSPKKLIEAKNISKKIGDRWLFRDFSFLLGPKSRVGLLGPNGCGKSTLIRTLIGQQPPDSGTVQVSEQIKISYFEQQRATLDPKLTVIQTICAEGDYVHVQGTPVFARSYLSRFHFRGDQMELPVGKLSGGEQSRLLVAQLMLQTEAVLVLDEPTNDLDINTLDVLQEALMDFPGAVILVTHDRYFMDQVANQILAFTDNDGEILRFADFFQWEIWHAQQKTASRREKTKTTSSPSPKVKKTFKEQHELNTMESTIQAAEGEVERLQGELTGLGASADYEKLGQLTAELGRAEKEVERLYNRWEQLSSQS